MGKLGREEAGGSAYLLRPATEHSENAECGPRTALETHSCLHTGLLDTYVQMGKRDSREDSAHETGPKKAV